jgi:heme/copper-type cytochrome/quinol oxidase subunit 1
MLSVWLILLARVLGRSPIPRSLASILFALLVLPWAVAPLLAAQGIQNIAARTEFTRLMQYGLFPVVGVFLVLCVHALLRAHRAGALPARVLRDPCLHGFGVSALLAIVGALLAAQIRGSTTMIPAHYHASIGAVTAAFMTVTYPILGALRLHVRAQSLRRARRVQPVLYGVGQMVFAIGFAVAGAHGMARKAYGAEQHARTAMETLGLVVMGLGGLVAIAGGVAFLVIVASARRRRSDSEIPIVTALVAEKGRTSWGEAMNVPSIRSRN